MFPTQNYTWECKDCAYKTTEHVDEANLVETFKLCPRCNKPMDSRPIINRGPFPENPFKKY